MIENSELLQNHFPKLNMNQLQFCGLHNTANDMLKSRSIKNSCHYIISVLCMAFIGTKVETT